MYVLGLEHHEVCSTFAIRELRMRSPARTISGVDVQLGWLGEMEKTPNGIGIVYTTCRDKYKLLADFGKLVSK